MASIRDAAGATNGAGEPLSKLFHGGSLGAPGTFNGGGEALPK